jgi:hypothetical protein
MPRKLKSRAKTALVYIPALNLLWDILKTLKNWLS